MTQRRQPKYDPHSLSRWLDYSAKEAVNGPKLVPEVPDNPAHVRKRASNPVGSYFTGHAKLLEPSDSLWNARIHPVPPASSITRSFFPEHHYTLDLPPKITSEKLRRADRSFLPVSPLTREETMGVPIPSSNKAVLFKRKRHSNPNDEWTARFVTGVK